MAERGVLAKVKLQQRVHRRGSTGSARPHSAPCQERLQHGILLVLPGKAIGSLSGFIDAVKAVFTVYGGSVAEDGTVTLTGWGQVTGVVTS
jgi:hypothetical protein